MDDRALLEAAAKAAGIGGEWEWPRGAKNPLWWRDASGKVWNPLTDDGDALRLAVKLGLVLSPTPNVSVMVWLPGEVQRGEVWQSLGSDPYAATRRAIVQAAAKIGRQMS